ncbi:diaminopimelate epimerase [Polycladidibacter hongkongensis]|uniref:diaminopimelate epimerase n=1 Tax=Polycladidibacter hongkongensis TaxID=1647556 RepID=UPI0008352EC5|nr:diaminopimelate epimerase [Pseudovibrio hongkongensis]
MADARIPFLKMNGLGNDFVVFDARQASVALNPAQIAAIGSRDSGIGFDQMITVERSSAGAYAFMRIHNRDGSQVDACGNATRCIGRLLLGEAGLAAVTIETNAGLLHAFARESESNVAVDMGVPRFDWQSIPLAEEFADTTQIELQIGPIDAPVLHSPSVVNVGNPHAIFWVEDIDAYELDKLGPLLENHPIFPQKANISLAQVDSPREIRLRVWERGVGITLACGTAACATAVAAARKGLCERDVDVHLPGGAIGIEWRASDDHIIMSGETEIEFEGLLDLETLKYERTAAGDAVAEPVS